jgi:hypothetical protein
MVSDVITETLLPTSSAGVGTRVALTTRGGVTKGGGAASWARGDDRGREATARPRTGEKRRMTTSQRHVTASKKAQTAGASAATSPSRRNTPSDAPARDRVRWQVSRLAARRL